MRVLEQQTFRFFVDWEVIDAEGTESLHLLDPFEPKPPDATAWLRRSARVHARDSESE